MATVSLYEEAFVKFRKYASERYRDSKEQEVLAAFLRERASPEDTIIAAQSLRDDTQQKYGGKKIGDVKIPGEWVDKIMGNIGNFIEAGNMIVNKGAPESVGMAWFAVRLTLSAIQNNYELYNLFGSGLGDITEIMIIIRHYDRLYDERANAKWKPSPLVEKLFGDVISAYQAVLDFSFAVRRHLTAGTLTRIKHGFKDFLGTSKVKFEGKLATIAELKRKIIEGSQGAFQDKTLNQLEGMSGVLRSLTGTVDNIKEFQEKQEQWHKESTARLDSILQAVEEFKATTKRKTPWDYALETFHANRKALKPLHIDTETLGNAIDSIHPGTCEWVFDDRRYQDWQTSRESSMLRVIGQEGTGKTTLLASIVKRLSAEEKPDEELLYISCDRTGTSGNSDQYNAKSICNTFLFQLYGLAVEGGEDLPLLEACNDLFKNPKSKDAKRIGKARVNKEDDLPDFAETFARISHLLKKNVVLVLDGVSSALSDHDQEELAREFQSLVGSETVADEHGLNIKVLLGCASLIPLSTKDDLPGSMIDIEDWVRADMAKVFKDALKATPSLSVAEQEEAEQTILPKAASQFRYLCQVAIPFIREPFVRPLSKRLEDLPGGLTDKYGQALQKMKPNYVGLLRTALTWSLLAPTYWPGWPVGREVMDAFYGTYEAVDLEKEEEDGDDDGKFPAITRLELDQLRDAAGPFLTTDLYQNDDGDYFVFPRDRQQVEEFCFKSSTEDDAHYSSHHNNNNGTESVCPRCKAEMEQTATVSIDPKQDHLRLAITCLRHLNHPTFQRRAGLRAKPVHQPSEEEDSDKKEEEQDEEEPEDGEEDTSGGAEADEDSDDGKPEDEVSACDSDESREVEVIIEERNLAEESEDDTGYNPTRIRYELQYWTHHIRQAEELWTPEERSESGAWKELFDEFDKFASNTELVRQWQKLHPDYISLQDEASKPLHIAASWGLVSVAEHVLKQGADPNELSRGKTALQAASGDADRLDLAKLLLASGADPNIQSEEHNPAMYQWMVDDCSLESVKTFLDAGADPSLPTHYKATAVHFLAAYGDDPAILDLLIDAGADINATDYTDSTPLHWMLERRDVPNGLLSAFVRKGANTNAEDQNSFRPLQMAANWGDIDALKTILAPGVEDIDDRDSEGDTALIQAAVAGHAAILRMLLEAGADPGIQNNLGRVALHDAIFHNKRDTVQVLLDWEKEHPGTIGINLAANHNRTPFFFACLSQDDEVPGMILDVLVQNNLPLSEINQLTKRGRSPLRQAADQGRDGIVGRLIQLATEQDDFASLFINTQYANNGMTALHRASKGGHLGCVRLLLQQDNPKLGTDISIKDQQGHTALQLAYQEWALESDKTAFEDIIALLIDLDPAAARADAELIGTIAGNGSVRLLRQLWRLQADLNMRDQYGWTPLEIARKFSQKSAEEFLSRQQAWAHLTPTQWGTTFPFVTPGGARVVVPAKEDPSSISAGGTRIVNNGEKTLISLAANRPLPAGLDEYYFEVTFEAVIIPQAEEPQPQPGQKHPFVAIGFCTIGGGALKFPGWEPRSNAPKAKSWALHGDDGGLYSSELSATNGRTAARFLPDFKYGLPGDTVGCGVNLRTREVFWTRNGLKIPGASFGNVDGRLFPVVGVWEHVHFTTNFGVEPFMWKGDRGEGEGDSAGLTGEGDGDVRLVNSTTGTVVQVDSDGRGGILDSTLVKGDVVAVSAAEVAVEV